MLKSSVQTKTILEDHAVRVNSFLVDFFEQEKAGYNSAFSRDFQMIDRLADFSLGGGKKLRPVLLYYGYKLLGGKGSTEILKASLAFELIHSFFLIHDDIMDESPLRRGASSVHKVYEQECEKAYPRVPDPARFGESLGILAGDLSHALGYELLLGADFSPELTIKALKRLNQAVMNTVFGQELDLRLEAGREAETAEVLRMYRLKTAQYTFECPLQIGGTLAGGDEKAFELMSLYALPLGTAFQIQDDILGLYGDERRTGKPAGHDIRQGKQTILVTEAKDRGTQADWMSLKGLLGKKDLTTKEVKLAREIVERTGALAHAQELSQRLFEQAEVATEAMLERGYDSESVEMLSGIAEFVVSREV